MEWQGSSNKSKRGKRQPPSSNSLAAASSSSPLVVNTSAAGSAQPAIIPVAPKLKRRFYEPLILLTIFSKSQGSHIAEEELIEPATHEEEEAPPAGEAGSRRSFLRHLALLCDTETGGDTATAIAAQQTPQGVVLWIASNWCSEKHDQRVQTFLGGILARLRELDGKDEKEVVEDIASEAIEFWCRRLVAYRTFLTKDLDTCLNHLSEQPGGEAASLVRHLGRLQELLTGSNQYLCRWCYNGRKSSAMEELARRSGQGGGCASRFERVRHYIGRLSQPVKAAQIIVSVARTTPLLCEVTDVIRLPSSQPTGPPLQERKSSLNHIIGRMVSDPTEMAAYRKLVEGMDHSVDLTDTLQGYINDRRWKPRVHAELLLLDHFHRHQELEFVAKDRYIAASKPACYCCYLYFLAHPGCFAKPACHNNAYINWRPPDVLGVQGDVATEDALKAREDILNEMVKTIRRDAFRQIDDRKGPVERHVDSTTGISTARWEAGTKKGEVAEEDEADGGAFGDEEAAVALGQLRVATGEEEEKEAEAEGDAPSSIYGIYESDRNDSESSSDQEEGGVSLL